MAKQNVSFKISGISNVQKLLIAKNVLVQKQAEKGVGEATRFIMSEVVQSAKGRRAEPASVDTGLFSSNQGIQHRFPTPLSGQVFATVDYAQHLERGTSKFKGRHHFRNTKNRNEKKINKFIENRMKQV